MNQLRSITSISGIPAFEVFEWDAEPAKRYNLIYGWNGAGKSTIGRILSFFEYRRVHLEDFGNVSFALQTDEGIVTEKTISEPKINVRVFNKEFIRSNVQFENTVANPIVIVGQESIELNSQIRSLEESLQHLCKQRDELRKTQRDLPNLDKVLTECGTAVVKEFLDTPFAHQYSGRTYNRRNVQYLIDTSEITEQNATSRLMPESEVTKIREQLQSRFTEIIFHFPDLSFLKKVFDEGNHLLQRVISVTALERLQNDHELRAWVKEGHRLHTERGATSCYFCMNPLPAELLAQYAAYFTEEVTLTENALREVITQLETAENELQKQLPDSSKFFTDLALAYSRILDEIDAHRSEVLIACETLRTRLANRLDSVQLASSAGEEVPFPQEAFDNLTKGLTAIAQLCAQHNQRLHTDPKALNEAAHKLELHVVAKHLLDADYFKTKAKRESVDKEVAALEQQIQEVEKELQSKRAAQRNINIAIDEINALIAQFLGPGEIELRIPQSRDRPWQYQITRRGIPTSYLSEGEKSVVALAYFLVKLREEGCEIEQTIVVLDDPVDSQDSIFLFRTFGLLKRQLKDAGQLFILTHNHELFNLVRDWLCTETYYSQSNLYWIEMKRTSDKRTVVVQDLHPLLRDHKSEYQYLFYRLYAWQENLEMLDAPLLPNLARKVLEYFASFKWSCRSSKELSDIVQHRILRKNNHYQRAIGDAVLKFINEYSHGHDFGRPVTSATLEADQICRSVLEFIRLSDKVHYNALVDKCKKHTLRDLMTSSGAIART